MLKITYWHYFNKSLAKLLQSIDNITFDKNGAYFNGSIEDFAKVWPLPFIVLSLEEVAVTQYGSFGSR